VGSRHGQTSLGCSVPSLHLGADTVVPSDHVRVLGVTISSDLSLDKHVSMIVRRAFSGFVNSGVSDDHETPSLSRHVCMRSSRLASTTVIQYTSWCAEVRDRQTATSTVLNAAARLVSNTKKYDRGLSRLLHTDLHWLDHPDRVQFKLCMTVRRCMQDKAPQYLKEYCISLSDTYSRQHLRSASRHLLSVLRHLRTSGRRAFAVAGPTAWNSLPDDLRNPSCCDNDFGRFIKSILFSFY